MERRISNIANYTLEITNGSLILRPKSHPDPDPEKQYMTENELLTDALRGSKVEECIIKKEEATISTRTNSDYKPILVDIWKSMPTQQIIKTTKFNIKLTNENGEKGYKWCKDIHMSVQNKDARYTLKEILNMVKVNKFTIELSIKLKTGRIVHFKIE